MARMTINALLVENEHLFDDMLLPIGCDRDNIIENILEGCSEFDCIYPYPDKMQKIISIWSKGKLPSWQKMYDVLVAEYNPLWNKDGIVEEEYIKENTGTNTVTDSGKDTSTNKGTVTDNVTGYNEDKLRPAGQSANDLTNEINYGKKTTTAPDLKEKFKTTRKEFGNIGITKSTELVESEILLRKTYEFANIIVHAFRDKFCVCLF